MSDIMYDSPMNIRTQIMRLALLSGMMPMGVQKEGRKFIHFSNGKQNVFIQNKGLNQDEVVINCVNICKATGVDCQKELYEYVAGQIKAVDLLEVLRSKVKSVYESANVDTYSSVEEKVMKEKSYEIKAKNMPFAGLMSTKVEETLNVVKKNIGILKAEAEKIEFNDISCADAALLTDDDITKIMKSLSEKRSRMAIDELNEE